MDSYYQQPTNLDAHIALEQERNSLLSEGYRLIGSCKMKGVFSYVLRHANGNRMTLRKRGDIIELAKNGLTIKSYNAKFKNSHD